MGSLGGTILLDMNKIVLIGNGFDLAHGLKTSYNDLFWIDEDKGYLAAKWNDKWSIIDHRGKELQILKYNNAKMVLKTPKWEKFIRINSNGVNLRKSPDTKSPKLLSSIGYGLWQEFSWSPQKEFEVFHFEAGTILPIINENAEWFCLYFNGAPEYCAYYVKTVISNQNNHKI